MKSEIGGESKEPRFFDTARKNDQVLKEILLDLQKRFPYFPRDFDFAAPIDDLLKKHGASPLRASYGRFTINDFIVGPDKENFWKPAEGEAVVDVQNMATLSGCRITASYTIQPDKSVRYRKTLSAMLS